MMEFEGLSVNVARDINWLEAELKGHKFLVGNSVTAADTMVLFGIQFIFARNLCGGRKLSDWKAVEQWVKTCESSASYKKAVGKTGHKL